MIISRVAASNKYARKGYMLYLSAVRSLFPVKYISYAQIFRHKTSNRLYALGSGASLSSFTKDMWNKISAHDSIGFNFFCLHKHVPTYHVSEASLDLEIMRRIFFNLALLECEYKSTSILWKEDVCSYAFRKQISAIGASYVKTINFNAHSPEQLSSKISKSLQSCQIRRESRTLSVYSQGSSLDWAIDFALLLGYEELVLCGFDLIDSRYFYDSIECDEMLRSELLKPKPTGVCSSLLHITNDPARCYGGIDALSVVNAYVGQLFGSSLRIYSSFQGSVLSSLASCHNWSS